MWLNLDGQSYGVIFSEDIIYKKIIEMSLFLKELLKNLTRCSLRQCTWIVNLMVFVCR